jgi:hypothetical protein
MAQPENLVEKNRRITKLVGIAETNRILKLRDEMDIVPWEGKKLTEDERQDLFEKIVVDEIAVKEIVDRERQLWHLSPDRNPKRLRKEVQRRYIIAINSGRIGAGTLPIPAEEPAALPPALPPPAAVPPAVPPLAPAIPPTEVPPNVI